MQTRRGLDAILGGLGEVIDNGLEKIKEIVEKPSKYLIDKAKKYKEEVTGSTPFGILYKLGHNIKSGFEKVKDRIPEYLKEIKDKISEYGPIIKNSALQSLPYPPKVLISSGLSMKNTYRGLGGKAVGYLLIGTGVVALVSFVLSGIHGLPSPNNENVHYVGSPDGYHGFVPKGVINYEGHTDPKGDLILDNGNVIHDAVWHGKYSDTIIQSHNLMVKLNSRLNGDMQDFYIIKGQVPLQQVTINGQTYYVIDANKINEVNVAGFYTYKEWVDDFVAAINTPGTYAAGLPGNSPVFEWQNLTGTVAYQTMIYGQYGYFPGRYVLVLPNKTIIPYGVNGDVIGVALRNFYVPNQTYNPSS